MTTVAVGTQALLVEAWNPIPRLVIVGASDLAVALTRQVELLGWTAATTVTADDAVAAIGELTSADVVVVIEHDPFIATPALAAALRGGVGYVGALGSRRTQASRRDAPHRRRPPRGRHRPDARPDRARPRGAQPGRDRRVDRRRGDRRALRPRPRLTSTTGRITGCRRRRHGRGHWSSTRSCTGRIRHRQGSDRRPGVGAPTYPSATMRDLRVIEVAGGVAGAYCGRLLAVMGADVVLVEPPDGAPLRRHGPHFTAADGTSRSAPTSTSMPASGR